MTDSIESRLAQEGITLPQVAAPAANYLPIIRAGNLVFTAGQLPLVEGKLALTGKLGADLDTEGGQAAARLCAINLLAIAQAAAGSLDKISRVVKLTVFVASAPGFTEQHLVANGASDFLAEALGERGRHARAAVGVAALPLGAAVEVDAIIAVADSG